LKDWLKTGIGYLQRNVYSIKTAFISDFIFNLEWFI